MLPTLVELSLFFCKLHKLPQNLPHVNFTFLKILDLSYNDFSSTILDWLFDIGHSLVYLNLSRCQLQGLIPEIIGNLTSLTSLDLSMNNLEGPIPLTLGLFQKKGLQLSTSSSLRELSFRQSIEWILRAKSCTALATRCLEYGWESLGG